MKKLKQTIATLAIIAVLAAIVVILLTNDKAIPSKPQQAPQYLQYQGTPSKIYLLSTATSYTTANETFTTAQGQTIEKGTPLFLITVTLRNDYTSDDPPPPLPNNPPISPADGTAYLYLNANLYNKNGVINATNVSNSDFSIPGTSGSGLVLASGQTESVNIYMMTNQTNINSFNLKLTTLSDSIPI